MSCEGVSCGNDCRLKTLGEDDDEEALGRVDFISEDEEIAGERRIRGGCTCWMAKVSIRRLFAAEPRLEGIVTDTMRLHLTKNGFSTVIDSRSIWRKIRSTRTSDRDSDSGMCFDNKVDWTSGEWGLVEAVCTRLSKGDAGL